MRQKMPDRFAPLAAYNARVLQGVVHTADYDLRMAALQAEFDRLNEPTVGDHS